MAYRFSIIHISIFFISTNTLGLPFAHVDARLARAATVPLVTTPLALAAGMIYKRTVGKKVQATADEQRCVRSQAQQCGASLPEDFQVTKSTAQDDVGMRGGRFVGTWR